MNDINIGEHPEIDDEIDAVIEDLADDHGPDEIVSLHMTSAAADQLVCAAFREDLSTGELVSLMLRDYLDKAGM